MVIKNILHKGSLIILPYKKNSSGKEHRNENIQYINGIKISSRYLLGNDVCSEVISSIQFSIFVCFSKA
jgi:hypothetical protein